LNNNGQLGRGNTTANTAVLQITTGIGSLVIAKIAGGNLHSAFLTIDGKVFVCGDNEFGQLGLGNVNDSTTAVEVTSLNSEIVKEIPCGWHYTMFLTNQSKVYACGANSSGQYGFGNTIVSLSPLLSFTMGNHIITQVACGGRSVNNSIIHHSLFLTNDGKVFACGSNSNGQLGDGTSGTGTNKSTPISILTTNIGTSLPITAISAVGYHSLFLRSDGKVFACGRNDFGQLGDGTFTSSSTPIAINTGTLTTNIGTSLPIIAIAAGESHSLFLRSDGKVFACGLNNYGALADGTGTNRSTPIAIYTTNIGTSLPITAIAAGDNHSLFLRSDGKVFGVGRNTSGQLGDYTPTNTSTPIAILTTNIGTSLPITAIAAGYLHSLFLRSDGKVFACGYNGHGQLGDGTPEQRLTPIAINTTNIGTSLPITAIAAGLNHSLFLRSDGKVFGVGGNNDGQLGNGSVSNGVVHPIEILTTNIGTSLPITAIATGYAHSLFLRSDGKVFACGTNTEGQLGDGTSGTGTKKSTPISIPVFALSAIYGSGLYTVSYSSFTASFEPFRCFNDTTTPNNEGRWAANNYTSGSYTNTSNLVSGYNGDWLVIKLPISIKLKRFDIEQISTALDRAPKNFRLYGSTNGSSWSLLVDKQNTTYTSLFYTHTDMSQYPSATDQYYNHFGLVVNTLVGSTETTLSFDEFFIYGIEQVTPLTITTTLNSTNKSLRISEFPVPANYNLKFPTPTFVNNISTSSNIILQGDYTVNILSSTSSQIIPNGGQINILNKSTLSLPTSNITLNYHLLNPIKETAQWTYSSANLNVYNMGNVGIYNRSPSYPLDVTGTMFVSSTAYTGSGQTTWTTVSDRRIKENIVKASYEKCFENVKNIELYRFNFKDNVVNTNDMNQLGFIAQEVQNVYPKAVEVNMIKDKTGEIPDLLSLNTTQIKYTLYGAVKNLLEKIEKLEKKLEKKDEVKLNGSNILEVTEDTLADLLNNSNIIEVNEVNEINEINEDTEAKLDSSNIIEVN
jgi:alpha-tubulin suppressor-like RCC1 family protein